MSGINFDFGFASNRLIYLVCGSSVTRYRVDLYEERSSDSGEFNIDANTIYDALTFSRGLVFDTDSGTMYTTAISPKPALVSHGENVVVRTFNNSKNYTNQIWSVKDDNVEIIAFDP